MDLFERLSVAGLYAAAAGDGPRSRAERAALRDELVKRHSINRACFAVQFGAPGSVMAATTNSTRTKPAAEFPKPAPLARCTPIAIANLQPGTTHRGRVLRGRLLVEPQVMTSAGTLLEDEAGNVVQLFVYNIVPEGLGILQRQAAGARALPAGASVAIIEPFFKVMADGTLGIRVDNPAEVVFTSGDAEPLDPADDGRRHFKAAQYGEAAECFARALLQLPSGSGAKDATTGDAGTSSSSGGGGGGGGGSSKDGSGSSSAATELLVAVLLNLSASHLQLGRPQQALLCASAAAAVNPSASKPHFRIAAALAAMGKQLAARCAVHAAFAAMPATGQEYRLRAMETAGVREPRAAVTQPTKQDAERGRTEMLRALAACGPLGDAAAASEVQPQGVPETAQQEPSAASGAGAAAAASKSAGTTAGAQKQGDASTSGEAVTRALTAAAAAKERANAAFISKRYEEALSGYQEASGLLRASLPAATLLANLAACHLHLSDPREALLTATASAALEPRNAKAHYRRAQALLQLGWLAEAEAACAGGLQALAAADEQGAAAIREMQKRVHTASATKGMQATASMPRGYMREREVAELGKAGSVSVEGTAAMNAFAQMAMKDPAAARNMERMKREQPLMWAALQKDDRVPPFHEEFAQAGRLPAECDREQCMRKLWEAYELCVGMASHIIGMVSVDGLDPMDLMLKRLGAVDPDKGVQRLLWLTHAAEGSVSFRDARASGYNPTIFHSYSNAASATISMPPAVAAPGGGGPRTHVAVGFVDLGSLAAAVGLPEWDAHVEASVREAVSGAQSGGNAHGASRTGPGVQQPLLRWVGYEASPYAVAKSLVVARMLRSGAPATEHVLQVWYSAAWSAATHAAFRRALTELLDEQLASGGKALPLEAVPYLRCWQLKDVGLGESRRRWFADRSRTLSIVGMWKEKADRLALAEYLLTGQLPGSPGAVGSVVMFATPAGGPERALDEVFLEGIPPAELLAARASASDVVAAGVVVLRRRVRRLAVLLASGRLEVQFVLRSVEPGVGDRATLSAIAALRPATIGWSNCPDYMYPPAFHAMAAAAACSAAATVHHVTSMNWPMEVKGGCHIDEVLPYMDGGGSGGRSRSRPSRAGAGGGEPKFDPPEALCRRITELLEEGKRKAHEVFVEQQCSALLFDPPVDNPRNVADFALTLRHYEAWANAFFAAGRLQPRKQAVVTAPPMFWPLSRSNTTFSVAFTYSSGGLQGMQQGGA